MTMHPSAFDEACARLQSLCAAQGPPDLVIGIVRGGQHVAQRIFTSVPHAMVTLQRQATRYKSMHAVHWLLRHLPYCVLDALRKAEAMHRDKHAPRRISKIALDDDMSKAIRGARNILIVDDSVDTGSIMLSVREAVKRSASPDAKISTAVLTVTAEHPLIRPDFALYRDGLLIRFTWSNDYKPCND